MNRFRVVTFVMLTSVVWLAACAPITAPPSTSAPAATPTEAAEAEVEFTVIDTADFDFTDAPYYKKCAIVSARAAMAGETIETVVDGLTETVNVANDGDYVVSNPGGEEYIVEKDRFESRYTLIEATENQFLPTGAPVQIIELDQNVEFEAPWGETQYILAGGFLIFNVDEVYGIQRQEFLDTYAPSNAEGQFVDEAGNPIDTLDVQCAANQP
ncbi:MAG: hypothetical protein WDZ49_01975 [Litorilinea sp.]